MGGGHYHKQTREFFYVLSGKLFLKVIQVNNKNTVSYVFNEGQCFEILPGEQHYMLFEQDTILVTLYSKSFSKSNPDTFVNNNLPTIKDMFNDTNQ